MLSFIGILILSLLISAIFVVLNATQKTKELLPYIALSFLVALLPFLSASPLAVSDSIEYVALARRIFFDSEIRLYLNGETLPSRYPIWFSLVYLQPFVAFGSGGLVFAFAGIFSFFLFIISTLFTLRFIDSKSSPLLLLSFLLLIPELRYFAPMPLTDILSAGLWGFSFLGFLLLRQKYSTLLACSTGLIIGIAFAIRPTNAFLFLPALIWFRRIPILLPGIFFCISNLVLNNLLYGSPFRTGYQFWLSIPYDFPFLTWSFSYLLENIQNIIKTSFIMIIPLFAVLCCIEFKRNFYAKLASITLVPLIFLYLFYFYFSPRFFFPTLAPFFVLMIYRVCKNMPPKIAFGCSLIFFCASLVPVIFRVPNNLDLKQEYKCLPKDGILVSMRNPLLVEEFHLRGTNIKLIPYSRNQEYANKVVTLKKPLINLAGVSAFDHRNEILKQHGSKEIYGEVFQENEKSMINRAPLYFDSSIQEIKNLQVQQVPDCPKLRQLLLP